MSKVKHTQKNTTFGHLFVKLLYRYISIYSNILFSVGFAVCNLTYAPKGCAVG